MFLLSHNGLLRFLESYHRYVLVFEIICCHRSRNWVENSKHYKFNKIRKDVTSSFMFYERKSITSTIYNEISHNIISYDFFFFLGGVGVGLVNNYIDKEGKRSERTNLRLPGKQSEVKFWWVVHSCLRIKNSKIPRINQK